MRYVGPSCIALFSEYKEENEQKKTDKKNYSDWEPSYIYKRFTAVVLAHKQINYHKGLEGVKQKLWKGRYMILGYDFCFYE